MNTVLIPKPSNIFAVGYDEQRQLCQITFAKHVNGLKVAGDTYEFEHSTREQVFDMIFADSVGGYFQRFFKPTHTQYHKLSDEETPDLIRQLEASLDRAREGEK